MLSLFGPDPNVFDILTWVCVAVFLVAALILAGRPMVVSGHVVSNVGLACLCAAFALGNDATDVLLVICIVLFLVAAGMLASTAKIAGHKVTNLGLALLSFAFLFTTP